MRYTAPVRFVRVLALACVATLLTAPAGADETPDLSGFWKLDRERSDDARKKIARAREEDRRGIGRLGPLAPGYGSGGPMGGGPVGRRPVADPGGRVQPPGGSDNPLAHVMDPPATLAITQSGGEISFDDYQDVRRLRPDGRKVKREGGAVEVRARYKDGDLVVEAEREDGDKSVTTYHVTADRKELHVTTEFELPTGEKLEVRHFYDSAEPPATSAR
jgi:hypothetical protein